MRKEIGIFLMLIVMIFACLPENVIAEDVLVKAKSPGYEIVVGRNVTFKWTKHAIRKQRSFKLITSAGTINANSSAEEFTWPNFPYGSVEWQVKIYRRKNQKGWIGTTSKQNFYHYINVSDVIFRMQNAIPESFAYKKGARNLAQTRDLTIFYELTKDYSIDIASYFTDLDNLPKPIDWDDEYDNTEQHRQDLYDYVKGLANIDADFIRLKDGFLTLKKGYRWDGTSNPFVWDEEPTDLRSSCIHDAFYDLMRMDYLAWDSENHFNWEWNDPGYMNRLVADTMHFMIAVEDKDKPRDKARSDWRTLRKLGRKNTNKDKLLRAFKYRVSGLTAWVSEDGAVDLHWLPANKADDDPKDYHLETHHYDIYRTTFGSSSWSLIDSIAFSPDEIRTHTDETVYYTDNNVVNGKTYYYQIRANDQDTDGDGWTDQEEDDYGLGENFYKRPGFHPLYNEKHYDESDVEAATLINGPGNALQLNGTTQYVEADSVSTELTGDSFTFEAWVYPEPQTGKSAIIAFNTSEGGNDNLLMYDGDKQTFCYYLGGSTYAHSAVNSTPESWYHVAVTINENDEGLLYVNGRQQATFSTSIRPLKTALFSIGQEWDGKDTTNLFTGKIDEVRIWNYARSLTEEIVPGMCRPMHGYHKGMAALWNFNEPPLSRRAYDTTIYSNDGTLIGYKADDASFVPSGAMNPIADAGSDQIVDEGSIAFFNGPNPDNFWDNNVSYEWEFGDSSPTAVGANVTHVYDDDGIYTVTLTLTASNGSVSTDTANVEVVNTAENPGDNPGVVEDSGSGGSGSADAAPCFIGALGGFDFK